MSPPMGVLDDAAGLASGDRTGMLEKTGAFPALLAGGLAAPLPDVGEPPRRILIGGMGGSAAAGRILSSWSRECGGSHLDVVSDYTLPATAEGDLLVACSYSGETEETLALFEEAGRRGLRRVVMASGGRLAEEASTLPFLDLPEGYPPRAAVPAALGRLLRLLEAWKLAGPPPASLLAELSEIAALCAPDVVGEDNPAKLLAVALGEGAPTLVSLAPAYEGVALRLRAQFEENAALAATACALPELHHNRWVAWLEGPSRPASLLWLGAADAHPRVLERRRISEDALANSGIRIQELPSRGGDRLTRLLTTLLMGDFISVYSAVLRGKDPGAIPSLDVLKARLNKTL